MARPTIACYMFGYNLNRIAYPWKACLRSALALAEQVYVAECFSQDNTYPDLLESFAPEIADGHLVVIQHPWGDYHDIQSHIANALLERIGHRQQFALKLDMDEVLCEWTFDQFWGDLAYMRATEYQLGRPRYVHFSPDDKTTFPFIYDSKAVISQTAAGLRFNYGPGQDACALDGAAEFQTQLRVHHYGKMHMGRREQALYKERTFTELYHDRGFPDLKVKAQWDAGDKFDYDKVFDVARAEGKFQTYTGLHPSFVQDWLKERREVEESYVR